MNRDSDKRLILPAREEYKRNDTWCVIIPNLPLKLKEKVSAKLIELFSFTEKECKETLSHSPIILLDCLSLAAAVDIKNHFIPTGANLELTDDDSYKKKCYRVVWPLTADAALGQPTQLDTKTVSDAGDWEKEAKEARQNLRLTEDALKELLVQVEAHRERLRVLEQEKYELEEKFRGAEEHLRSKEEEVRRLHAAYEETQGAKRGLETELQKTQDDLRLKDQTLQTRSEEHQQKLGLLETSLIQKDQDCQESQASLRLKEEALKELQTTFDETKEHLEKELDQTIKEARHWKHEACETQNVVQAQVEERVQKLESLEVELSQKHQELEALKAHLNLKEEAWKKWEEQREQAARDWNTERAHWKEKMSELEAKANGLETVRDELTRSLNEERERSLNIGDEIARLTNTLDRSVGELAKWKNRSGKLEIRIRDFVAEVHDLKKQAAEQVEHIYLTKDSLQTLQSEYETSQVKLHHLQEAKEDLELKAQDAQEHLRLGASHFRRLIFHGFQQFIPLTIQIRQP